MFNFLKSKKLKKFTLIFKISFPATHTNVETGAIRITIPATSYHDAVSKLKKYAIKKLQVRVFDEDSQPSENKSSDQQKKVWQQFDNIFKEVDKLSDE
jgi:hypothetical protein